MRNARSRRARRGRAESPSTRHVRARLVAALETAWPSTTGHLWRVTYVRLTAPAGAASHRRHAAVGARQVHLGNATATTTLWCRTCEQLFAGSSRRSRRRRRRDAALRVSWVSAQSDDAHHRAVDRADDARSRRRHEPHLRRGGPLRLPSERERLPTRPAFPRGRARARLGHADAAAVALLRRATSTRAAPSRRRRCLSVLITAEHRLRGQRTATVRWQLATSRAACRGMRSGIAFMAQISPPS